MAIDGLLRSGRTVVPAIIALLLVILVCIGVSRHFVSVPLNDMWNGMLGFEESFFSGNVQELFKPHNEHVILWTKLLFALNALFFNSNSLPLVALNLAIMVIASLVFVRLLFVETRSLDNTDFKAPIIALIVCLVFLWIQEENILWAFQSQFFLAFLFPLISFVFLASSVQDDYNGEIFTFGALIALASVGTMANGILCLPIAIVLLVYLRVPKYQILVLGVLCVAAFYLFLLTRPPTNQSLVQTFVANPLGTIGFALAYLASPLSQLVEGMNIRFGTAPAPLELPVWLAIAIGALIPSLALYRTIQLGRENAISPQSAALVAFILYVGATAFLTGIGRYPIAGFETADSSRYTTPALWAWIAVLILWSRSLMKFFSRNQHRLRAGSLILIAVFGTLFAYQFRAIGADPHAKFDKRLAALSLELGAKDHPIEQSVYPIPHDIYGHVAYARENDVSVFGDPLFRDLSETLGNTVKQVPTNASPDGCRGYLDAIERVSGASSWRRVRGWLYDGRKDAQQSNRIAIIDGTGAIYGYAITGHPRPDVDSHLGRRIGKVGYMGYVQADAPEQLYLIANGVHPEPCYIASGGE